MQIDEFLSAVLHDLDNLKAINVVPLDVRSFSSVTDYMIVATGNSKRHVKALADNLIREMKIRKIEPIGIDGDLDNDWILVDLGDVVVHIMQPETRDFYQLEKLWSPSCSQLALA